VAQYFEKNHGDIRDLSQRLLNGALRSILEDETADNPEKIGPLVEMLKPY